VGGAAEVDGRSHRRHREEHGSAKHFGIRSAPVSFLTRFVERGK
jgi:hypothetical protein